MKKTKTKLSIENFLKFPTEIKWKHEIEKIGWTGPDGSSVSRDNIEGIVIGTNTSDFADSKLPANLHDWRYQIGRRLKLPEKFRRVSDKGYRDDCIKKTSILVGFSGWKARRRSWFRYRILRAFGWRA